jgi:hypothetical protein
MEEEGKGGVKGEVGDKGKGLTDAYVCYPGTSMPCTFCFVISTFQRRMSVTMGYQDSDRAREGTAERRWRSSGSIWWAQFLRQYFLLT